MPKFAFAFALVAGLVSLLPAGAQPKAAQKPAPRAGVEITSDTPIVLDVTRVNILFTVSDKKGRFVSNLVKDDFEIFEAKKAQNILEFNAESDLPLRIAVLLDTSNSIRERFRFIQEAALEFLRSTIRPRTDKALVVGFDTSAQLVADLTDEMPKLEKSIREMRAGGGTALFDALYFACRDKITLDQPRHKFRRAIIIISDGDDTQSRYTREQALEMVQKSDAVVYTISTNITRVETDGDKILRYLAKETGGQAFFPFKVEDLSQSFTNIANELRSQYNLFFRPEPLRTDGLYHQVDVRVKNRKDVVVRARKGYYAPNM